MPANPAAKLTQAILRNDLTEVKELVTANPTLKDGALGEATGRKRFEIANWLVANGVDINAEAMGCFPRIFMPCENLEPDELRWYLDHGANPNCARPDRKNADPGTALDYVISTYVRRPRDLIACIDMLLAAGTTTRYNVPVVLDLLRGRVAQVAEQVDADPGLLHQRFPQLDFGTTGGRFLSCRGGTLLHVAAEYGSWEIAKLLLDRGADVNARSTVDANGVGGQTPVFHSATQFDDLGLPITRLLIERGADLNVRAKLTGRYDRPDEIVEGTLLAYALRFADQKHGRRAAVLALLRDHGAREH